MLMRSPLARESRRPACLILSCQPRWIADLRRQGFKVPHGLGNGRELAAPVPPVPGPEPHPIPVRPGQDTVAVMLDLMQPYGTARHRVREGRLTGQDKARGAAPL